MSFCGFEPSRVRSLATALQSAATDSSGLSTTIGSCLDEAHEIIMTTGSGAPGPDGYWSTADDVYRSGLSAVDRAGSEVSAEISRRLNHLLACEQLQHSGFAFNLLTVFADEPAPTPEQVAHDLAEFRMILGEDPGLNGNRDDLQKINDLIAGITPAGKEAFVAALTTDDFARWNSAAGRGDGWFSDNGLTNDQLLDLGSSLQPSLSLDQVKRLATGMPLLEPEFHNLDHDVDGSYTWWPGSLDDNPPDLSTLHQGNAGDCWFLSGLAAEIQQNPNFVQEHLVDNGNGTYTVTFYRDGAPVEVTVDGSLPTALDGSVRFAHGNEHWTTGGPLWAAIYEKAYARLKQRYGNIEGGWGDEAMASLDNRPTHRSSPDDVSLEDIQNKLANGSPVTVGTTDDSGFWWWQDDDDERVDDKKLVSHHEYRVKSVTKTDDGWRIQLVNPWGTNSSAAYEVELTEPEYNDWINEVAWSD
jgi:hypothetical protein